MEKGSSAHVCDGYKGHDDERANQITLCPCFDDKFIGFLGLLDYGPTGLEARNGTHGEGCAVESEEVWCRRARRCDVTLLDRVE